MILLDGRGGPSDGSKSSAQLALHEPVRSLLAPCPDCRGAGILPGTSPGIQLSCPSCRSTGRQLSRITTRNSPSGPDILFAGNGPDGPVSIAVEAKSLVDLIQAGDTGRLMGFEGQLPAMLAEGYDQCWVLVYGLSRASRTGMLEVPWGSGWRVFTVGNGREVPYGYLHGLLVEIAAMGAHTRLVRNIEEAAQWIGVLYRWWAKAWGEHDLTRRFDKSRRFPVQPGDAADLIKACEFIAQCPGIGYEKARSVVEHFGSVYRAVNAGVDEWVKVPGIGKTLAKAACEYLRREVR